MADPEPGQPLLDGLLRNANPGGDIPAQQSLRKLQSALFGRSRPAVQLGRYVIEERIGAGGSGVVYRAFDPKHDRKVALKLLHAGQGKRHEAARHRLLREAQLLAKLSHPNVVRIYDVGAYDPEVFDPSPSARFGHRADDASSARDSGVYLAMEYLDGSDLAHWLADKPRDWEAVREVFLSAGRGLVAAHEVGLIHRDFKPANVSIDAKGQVRVLDFGLARPLAKHIPDPSMRMTKGAKQRLNALARPFDATLTAPGTLLGTPAYMAPEQHDLQRGSAFSDQYSFCLALYEAWFGHRPFLADNEQELRRLKGEGRVLPPPDRVGVPAHLFDVLRRGLSARPHDRFPTTASMLDALVAPAPAKPWPRALIWGATGVAVALAVGIGGRSLMDAAACDGASWTRDWGEGQRARLTQRDDTEPFVTIAAEQVAQRIDERVEDGIRFDTERCDADDGRAPHVEACVERQRAHLTALLDTLYSADDTAMVAAADAVSRWPPPSACRDRLAEPELASLADALDDARLLEAQGRSTQALTAARNAYTAARQHGDVRLLVEAAELTGHLALQHGTLTEAEPALAEALWSSGSARRRDLVVRAALGLLTLARRATSRPVDTPLWMRLARDQAAMPEVPNVLRMRLYLELGRLALADGDLARARADLSNGLALDVPLHEAAWTWRLQLALAETLERDGHGSDATQLR
ncbi:MAG: protein kinase, partial [Deltaproteobacteria bacterium]|nr:protein kinase [Deltaproteobacteria bacterium]